MFFHTVFHHLFTPRKSAFRPMSTRGSCISRRARRQTFRFSRRNRPPRRYPSAPSARSARQDRHKANGCRANGSTARSRGEDQTRRRTNDRPDAGRERPKPKVGKPRVSRNPPPKEGWGCGKLFFGRSPSTDCLPTVYPPLPRRRTRAARGSAGDRQTFPPFTPIVFTHFVYPLVYPLTPFESQ